MENLKLPSDLVKFLSEHRQLDYPADDCEAGQVSLFSLAELRLSCFMTHSYGTPLVDTDPNKERAGVYHVPGVDLIAKCTGDYDPEGLLVWFPEEQSFGVCDTDHDYILIFGTDVTWTQIAASAAAYINAIWAFPDMPLAPANFLMAWPKYPFY